MLTALCLVVTAALVTPAASQVAGAPKAFPTVVNEVLSCRTVTDAAARLACFDRSVAALGKAQTTGELVTLDRQEVRKTRRSLFGLALPDLRILSNDQDGEDGSQIETRIVRTAPGADGKWVFQLAEGGRWAQIDSREFVVDPAPGQPIRIRRAALGSFLANINNQRAIRVKRLN
jgi:hypothetical protein